MEAVFGWVATYGYGALFALLILGIVGLPIPDETLLVFCGYLISRGKLDLLATYFTALAGSCCGITVSYFIGRTAGLAAVHRFGRYLRMDQKQLDRVHGWFGRSGHWALFGGYYIAGVRHFTAIIAGASKLEFHTFALYAWGGAAAWVAVFLTLGYVIGEQWRAVADLVHTYLTYISVVGVVLLALYFAGRRWMRRRTGGA
jgi:membrane protein DedA with SNARE-associated domain